MQGGLMGSFGFHCAECDLPMLSDGPTKDDYCFKCEEEFSTLEEGGGCKSTNYLLSPDGDSIRGQTWIDVKTVPQVNTCGGNSIMQMEACPLLSVSTVCKVRNRQV